MRPKLITALFICLAAAAAAPCLAQQTPTPAVDDDDEVERVNVHLVSLPVSVVDRDGRFVADLRAEDFRVTENGVAQQITNFASVEQPFSVLLLIDTSGSTQIKLRDIQESAVAFVNQLRPQDRVLPVAFDNDAVALLPEWTGDRARLTAAIRSTRTGMVVEDKDRQVVKGRDGKPVTLLSVKTRLYDAVHKAAEALRGVKGRKALILFTDGFDSASTAATRKSTLAEVEELDALVYVVQYDRYGNYGPAPRADASRQSDMGPRPGPKSVAAVDGSGGRTTEGGSGRPITGASIYAPPMRPLDQRFPSVLEAEKYLESLAEKTGGRFYRTDSLERIAQSFAAIAEELRRMYSVGYRPEPLARPGERREVKVKVGRERVSVRARKAYVFKPRG